MKPIITAYQDFWDIFLIDSGYPGPTISIFWWIHWDEISGVRANKKFFQNIKNGSIVLNKWKLILVLEANQQAIQNNTRQIRYNMNRLFDDTIQPASDYEHQRGSQLRSILKISDYLLDLHSTSWPSEPFLYAEMDHFDLAKKMWVSHVVWWWWELSWDTISWDTEIYINSHGWVWFTFEAGDHLSKHWFKYAYQMILNFLSTLAIIDQSYFCKIGEWRLALKITDYYVAQSWNFKYNIDIQNFQRLSQGTLIWKDDDKVIYAHHDMIFIMPKLEEIIEPGVEVFFIWKEI